jgi:hypothetical protein
MFARITQQPDHVVIVERIKRLASFPAHTHQTGGAQQAQLVGHRGFGDADERRQITDTPFAVRQRVKNADTGGIGEQFEDVGDRLKGHAAQEPRANHFQVGGSGVGINTRDGHHPLIYEQLLICQSAARPANIERIRVPDYDPVSVQARDGPAITPISKESGL